MLEKNDINYSQLLGLKKRTYTESDVNEVCKEIDDSQLALKLEFKKNVKPNIVLSKHTWNVKQGHYLVMVSRLNELLEKEDISDLEGSLIIWLNDGIWEKTQKFSRKAPVLTFGRPLLDAYSFLIPDPAFFGAKGYIEDLEEIRLYEEKLAKKEKRIFWRGAATGTDIEFDNWRKTGRGRLVSLANEIADSKVLDAKLTKYKHLSDEKISELKAENVTDEIWQFVDFLKYKYQVDIDGYSCAWLSCFLKLSSKSIVLKIEGSFEQWYYNQLIPWKHFIPISKSIDEISDIYQWLLNNDSKVEEIISEANLLMGTITYKNEEKRLVRLFREILSCQKI